MNKFAFITHVTPLAKRNSLRKDLFALYETALLSQNYRNWFVIQLHEGPDETDGQFHRFHLPDADRDEKTRVLQGLFKRDDFTGLIASADYLIKLDDDDLISPNVLTRLSDFDGDLFYDAQHTFYDITSGILTQQQRPWMASTCVHRTRHALAEWKGEGASAIGNLLYSDHSKSWHQYYHRMKVTPADRLHPIYARVLSPTSITSGGNSAVKTIADVNMKKYYQYLRSFGKWDPAATTDFDGYVQPLAEAWRTFSGEMQKPIQGEGMQAKLSSKLRALKSRMRRNE